jgi:hypothetical protein
MRVILISNIRNAFSIQHGHDTDHNHDDSTGSVTK